MINWSELNKSRKSRSKNVIYAKTFYNPAMYPHTSKPKLLRTLDDFSLIELLELEGKLLPDPTKLRVPLSR